jgi:anaerobic C4-dicarboxylate transporter
VSEDPIVARRARIRRYVALAQRVGYGALGVAIVVFVIGASSGFPGWSVAATIGALVAAIAVLPAPIVVGYGLRAAEREDAARRRERGL